MEIKPIPMTDEYAAHYFYKQGYMASRISVPRFAVNELLELAAKRIEAECDYFNPPSVIPNHNRCDHCTHGEDAQIVRGLKNGD